MSPFLRRELSHPGWSAAAAQTAVNTCALAHPSPSPWLIVGWTWMTRESVARRQNDLPRQEPALSSRTREFDACHHSSCNRRPPRLVIVLSSCVFSALFSSSRSAQRSATCTSSGYCTGTSSPPTYFSPSTGRYVRAERTTKGGPKKEKWGRMRFSQENLLLFIGQNRQSTV